MTNTKARRTKAKTKQMKRAFVSLPDGVWDIIRTDLKGRLGEGDSEIIRNIVISYLSDKGYFMNEQAYEGLSEIDDRITVLDHMVTSLSDALQEKGVVSFAEIDKRVKRKIEGTETDQMTLEENQGK